MNNADVVIGICIGFVFTLMLTTGMAYISGDNIDEKGFSLYTNEVQCVIVNEAACEGTIAQVYYKDGEY